MGKCKLFQLVTYCQDLVSGVLLHALCPPCWPQPVVSGAMATLLELPLVFSTHWPPAGALVGCMGSEEWAGLEALGHVVAGSLFWNLQFAQSCIFLFLLAVLAGRSTVGWWHGPKVRVHLFPESLSWGSEFYQPWPFLVAVLAGHSTVG